MSDLSSFRIVNEKSLGHFFYFISPVIREEDNKNMTHGWNRKFYVRSEIKALWGQNIKIGIFRHDMIK